MPETYKCGYCCEDYAEVRPHFAIAGDASTFICLDCAMAEIVPKFHEALNYEIKWPPKWGDAAIDPELFIDMLGDSFIDSYKQKEIEYYTLPTQRVYCPHLVNGESCNQFLGLKEEHGVICPKCYGGVCKKCVGSMELRQKHVCPGEPALDDDLEGIPKGVQWQACPHCQRKLERVEGCNEMTCQCNTHFCYLCGKTIPVEERHTHWTRAQGCPRYGSPAEREITEEDWDFDPDALNNPNGPQPAVGFQGFDLDDLGHHILELGEAGAEIDAMAPEQVEAMIQGFIGDRGFIPGTPGSDNDFVGAAMEMDQINHEPEQEDDPRRPTIDELRTAFLIVHDNIVPLDWPSDDPTNRRIQRALVDDRTTLSDAIAENLGQMSVLIDPQNPPMDPARAHEHAVVHEYLSAVQAFLLILSLPFSRPDLNLRNAIGAIQVAIDEVDRWSRRARPDLVHPEVEDIANARIPRGHSVINLIATLLDARDAEEREANMEVDVDERHTPEAFTPQGAFTP